VSVGRAGIFFKFFFLIAHWFGSYRPMQRIFHGKKKALSPIRQILKEKNKI
jgi:hypothetical protein